KSGRRRLVQAEISEIAWWKRHAAVTQGRIRNLIILAECPVWRVSNLRIQRGHIGYRRKRTVRAICVHPCEDVRNGRNCRCSREGEHISGETLIPERPSGLRRKS